MLRVYPQARPGPWNCTRESQRKDAKTQRAAPDERGVQFVERAHACPSTRFRLEGNPRGDFGSRSVCSYGRQVAGPYVRNRRLLRVRASSRANACSYEHDAVRKSRRSRPVKNRHSLRRRHQAAFPLHVLPIFEVGSLVTRLTNDITQVQELILMLGTYAAAALTTHLQMYVMADVAQHTVRDIQNDLFTKLQTLSLRFFDQRQLLEQHGFYHNLYMSQFKENQAPEAAAVTA